MGLPTHACISDQLIYSLQRFAAVIMRIREPKTTALIFASGKMVVTGAKSEDDSKLASRKYARIIQKLGFNAKFTDFKIQNIVGSCDIKFPIRLEGLASRHHNFSSYEPELFPGLIYRMIKPKIVLLIFVSGKIVLTGAKVREEIYQAFEMIYPVLQGLHPGLLCYSLPLLTCWQRLPQGLEALGVTQDAVAARPGTLHRFVRLEQRSRYHDCFSTHPEILPVGRSQPRSGLPMYHLIPALHWRWQRKGREVKSLSSIQRTWFMVEN